MTTPGTPVESARAIEIAHDRMWRVIEFSAAIFKLGINPVVDPPEHVVSLLLEQVHRSKGPIPVRGRMNGAPFRQTLVKHSGAWRLYINCEMLKAADTSVGDRVRISIEIDPEPREVPMPARLQSALEADQQAKTSFDRLTPSRQKEIFRYINSLRTDESVARNIEKVILQLKSDQVD